MIEEKVAETWIPLAGALSLSRRIQNRLGFKRDGQDWLRDCPAGRIRLRKSDCAEIWLETATFGAQQTLRDTAVEMFESLRVGRFLHWSPSAQARPKNQHWAQVVDRTQISPNFMRLRLAGEFSDFIRPGAGNHFRFLFPRHSYYDWPGVTAQGKTDWPGGIDDWHRPPYTVRALCPNGTWLDVDIVLHEGGRMTDWCCAVEMGAEIAIHGPNGSGLPYRGWRGFVVDETAVPIAIRHIQLAGPEVRGKAIFVVRDLEDAQAIETDANIEIEWRLASSVDDWPRLVAELDWPESDRHIFMAGERQHASQVRQFAKAHGLASKEFSAAAYWTDGWVPPW